MPPPPLLSVSAGEREREFAAGGARTLALNSEPNFGFKSLPVCCSEPQAFSIPGLNRNSAMSQSITALSVGVSDAF